MKDYMTLKGPNTERKNINTAIVNILKTFKKRSYKDDRSFDFLQ